MTHIARPALSRRTLLRAAGATLALPFLDAMRPAFGQTVEPPRRLLAICTNLGLLERHFVPAEAGRDYALTPYLETLKEFRDQFTVFSGTSHPDVTGGHSAEATFLTAAPHPGSASFRNSISLDQFAAEQIGHQTRVAALPLVVAKSGNQSLSFTSSGVMLPAERSPSQLFAALFVAGDAAAMARQIEDLRTGRSILDAVATRSAALQKQLGSGDRHRLDQYFTSVREVERRLLIAEEWERQPKPQVAGPAPQDGEYLLEKLAAMYDLAHLVRPRRHQRPHLRRRKFQQRRHPSLEPRRRLEWRHLVAGRRRHQRHHRLWSRLERLRPVRRRRLQPGRRRAGQQCRPLEWHQLVRLGRRRERHRDQRRHF